jgi:hypothetical protein
MLLLGLILPIAFSCGATAGLILGAVVGGILHKHLLRRMPPLIAILLSIAAASFGIALGVGLPVGLLHHWLILTAVLGTGIPLLGLVVMLNQEAQKKRAAYRRTEPSLISP